MDIQTGFTVWFTGLPRSGKTTLANLLAQRLRERGPCRIEVLDAAVRRNLGGGPGATREGQSASIRCIVSLCNLLSRNDVATAVAVMSPYREMRENARRVIDRFVEVFVDCPLEICIERETKGCPSGPQQLAGISDVFEPPLGPEVVCKTSEESPGASVKKIIATLERLRYISAEVAAYSPEEEELVRKRLEGLGYL